MFDRGEAVRKLILNMARLSGLALLAERFAGGIGVILMLHRVTDKQGKELGLNRHLSITPEFLDAVLGEMKRLGYRFVSMDEAADRMKSGGTERFAAVTLDDAYHDNLTEALPIFEKHQAPFTIYVASALLDRTIDLWWESLEDIVTQSDSIAFEAGGGRVVLDCSTPSKKIAAARRIHDHLVKTVPEQEQPDFVRELARSTALDGGRLDQPPLMDWEEIRRMAGHPLGTIGAHTVHHYNLARLSAEAAWDELVEGARILAERIGEKPRHLAYPYGYLGAVGAREVQLAREAGYVSAVTTRHGVLRPDHARHLHALPRISVNGRYQSLGHIRTMLSGVTTPIANRGKRLVTI